MKWIDYREKLSLGFKDDQKLAMCKNRFRNFLPEVERFYADEALMRYANTIGESYDNLSRYGTMPIYGAATDIFCSDSLTDFISRYIALIHSCKHKDNGKDLGKILEENLRITLEDYSIPYEVFQDKDGLYIFPKGVEEFDKELVSKTLMWLSDYPETEKEWCKALRKYANNEATPSEVADDFRKALERFFQNFFNTQKALENMKSEYGQYLKNKGVSSGVSGNLETMLQQYTNFINDHAKHHDSVSRNVLEYIMYQTGNIMRLLITLRNAE